MLLTAVLLTAVPGDVVAASRYAVKEENVCDYKVEGNTVYVRLAEDDAYAGQRIEAALDYAKVHATDKNPITVKVPAGKYTFQPAKAVMYTESGYDEAAAFRGLHIYSNTVLDVRGCTFRMAPNSKYMERYLDFGNQSTLGELIKYKGIRGYNSSKACAGYKGFRNIAILGGKWIGQKYYYKYSLFKLYHAENVLLSGMDIMGGTQRHLMEVAGVSNLLITDCKFRDYVPQKPGLADEALQIDIPCNTRMMKTGYEDGTPNRHIYIQNCTFANAPTAIGTHSVLYGTYHRDIHIVNNTFSGISDYAINAVAYENVQISGNTITNAKNGIALRPINDPDSDTLSTICMMIFNGEKKGKGKRSDEGGIVIKDNQISVRKNGEAIHIGGVIVKKNRRSLEGMLVPSGNYYMNHISISNNKIFSKGKGIYVYDALNVAIFDNQMKGKIGKGSIGVYLERCKADVYHNSLQQWKHGIHSADKVRGSIYENEFSNVTKLLYTKKTKAKD